MNAREYAFNTLKRVFNDHGYASIILRHRKEEFNDEDVALISEIVYGTVRNHDFLEYQWQEYANTKVRSDTALLLDMSIYQLLFLDRIPEYAIINEANELAVRHDKGFVNAILRKVARRGKKLPDSKDELENLAILTTHPKWLLGLWKAHYGMEIMERIAKEDQKRPVVYGRINTLKISKEEFEQVEGVTFIDEICFMYDGNLVETDYFKDGKVLIQDYSSQQVAKWLDAKPNMSVLDVCSAPGTKTQQVAMYMENKGSVVAYDLYEDRIRMVNELMQRTNTSIVDARAHDATLNDTSIKLESMDRILVDAPCSGLGDLSHKPEIRFHVTPNDLDEICNIQKEILERSCTYLKKDGILVYSTCTLNKKENEKQVAAFLKRHEEFELIKEQTIFPYEHHSDGFYMAKLKKIA